MPSINRHTALFSLAGALVSACPGLIAAQQSPPDRAELEHIRVPNVVGAVFIPPRSFALLTERPRPGDVTAELFVDDLVHLTRIALSGIQSWAFSLEFDRPARRPFRQEDIRQAPQFVRALRHPSNAATEYVAHFLPAGALTGVNDEEQIREVPARVRRALVDAINRARQDPDLFQPGRFDLATLSPEARQALAEGREVVRINRLLLEDEFPEFLARDIGSRYVIKYLAQRQEEVVRRELSGSRLEARLLAGDIFLKQAAYAVDLPRDLALGVSQVALCQIEFQDVLERDGAPGTEAAGPFVLNFNLETDFAYPRELGLGFLFKNPRLVIRHGSKVAGAEAPACVQRFAEILNRNLGRVLEHPGPLGDALRSMKALLLVNEAIHWGLSVFIPVNERIVRSFPTLRVDNQPPDVDEFRVIVNLDGHMTGMTYEGGVRFGRAQQRPPAHTVAMPVRYVTPPPAPQSSASPSHPGFIVSAPGDAEPWMRVDISSILALGPR